MRTHLENHKLTPEQCEQARECWDALMFAPSPHALELARLALGKRSLPIQLAVMNSITQLWIQEHEPTKDENPFAPHNCSC